METLFWLCIDREVVVGSRSVMFWVGAHKNRREMIMMWMSGLEGGGVCAFFIRSVQRHNG